MQKHLSNYFKDWEIYIDQCGPNSQLNLTELSNICQQTAAIHSELWGMSYFDMQKSNQAWVLSTMRFEILDTPKWHEIVTAETWIESLKGMRSVRDFEIKKDDTVLARASSLWVVLNTERRRPEPLAVPYDELIQYPERKATEIPTGKIDLNKDAKKCFSRKVAYSDLDIVGHANNVKYMEWSLDLLPIETILNNKIEAIDLNYIKEVHYQDNIDLYIYEEEHLIYFYIKRDDVTCFAMKLQIKP